MKLFEWNFFLYNLPPATDPWRICLPQFLPPDQLSSQFFFRINATDNFKTNLLFSRMYVYEIIEWQETIKKLLVNYTLGPMHKIIPLNYGLPRSSHLHIFLIHKIERKSMSFSKILCFWVKKNSLSKQKAFTIWARCPCLLEGSFRLKIIEN